MDDDREKLELQLKLLKDEVSFQANAFDQIDTKTGIALGLTFVVIGQVLAAILRMAVDHKALQGDFPLTTNCLFGVANFFSLLAIGFGVTARWPCEFHHSIGFSTEELDGPYCQALEAAIKVFGEIITTNQAKINRKERWAAWTNIFVILALLVYLVLTVFLYFFNGRAGGPP